MIKNKQSLKTIFVNILMVSIFSLLLAFSVWLVWMYFVRGPIDIETRGYVSKTLIETSVQPTEKEKYTLQHFHNLDAAVLRGIEYTSTCVTCHGDYPHNKTPKVRAFFNAHAWFMACETCHGENNKQENITFRWLDNDTNNSLTILEGERGIYGARIVPILTRDGIKKRLDNLIDKESVVSYINKKEHLNELQDRDAINEMHKILNEKPASCDNCHIENSMLNFKALLYSDNMSQHLRSIDVGTMITGYKAFHLPNVLRPRN